MSARPRICYPSDAEFQDAVRLLDALCDASRPFVVTTANKDHTDEFGNLIGRGDTYYKRELGVGFGNDIKLSEASMERLCCSILFENRWLTAIAEKVAEQRATENAEAMAKVAKLISDD